MAKKKGLVYSNTLRYQGSERHKEIFFWGCMLALCLLKYLSYGFHYYPLLDDYIQYWFYPNAQSIWNDIVMGIGLYNAHPLSSLADPYIWGQMWNHMGVALLIITLMHVAGAYLISKSLEHCGFSCGGLFAVLYLLLPMGMEATYWLSAATRIVVGLFFVGASLWALVRFLESDKKAWFWMFAILELVSFGFYEQVVVIGFALSLLVVWRVRKRGDHRMLWLAPFINLALTGVYYLVFSGKGAFAGRSGIVSMGNLSQHIRFIFDEIYHAWGRGLITMNYNGFLRGLELLGQNIWYLALVAAVCVLCALAVNRRQEGKQNVHLLWLVPALFLLPYAPLFLLQGSMVPFRNTFTSVIAIGLAAAFVFDFAVRNLWVRRAVVACIAFVLMTVSISEYADYRAVSMADAKICNNIAAVLDDDVLAGQREAVLVGTKWYYTEQNVHHREHIYNLTQSDWALTGGMRYYTKSRKLKRITPVEELTPELAQSGAQLLYIDENMNVTRIGE